MKRKYLPTLSELIDRLSIVQLKEVFIPEHKDEYALEIADIVHDIQAHIDENKSEITAISISIAPSSRRSSEGVSQSKRLDEFLLLIESI